ncbi:MAG TPA: acyl-CoA dehydrogenase family protein [Acidimicrobiia bacterium]|nr:acyl-CoA dehydrogenase family protein [Acidimicrobiia bacterium]
MSIYLDEDLRAIASQTAEYVEREIVPKAEAWESEGRVPREVLRHMGGLGFFGLRVPEEYGGIALGPLASVVFAEQLGRSTFGGFTITVLAHTDLAMPYITKFASDELKSRYLPPMMAGERIGGLAVTEPDAGSDVAAIRTIARRDGDIYVINGTKMFITNGAEGDLLVVAAKTDADVKGSRGVSMFVVERGTEGFSVGRALPKMGWRSSDTAELVFADCRVPVDNLIGEENRGFYYIMENFQNERLILAGQSLGEAQRAVELTVEFVKHRRAFGSPLWNKQTIRQRLAMDQARIDAARLLTYHAAWLEGQGHDAVQAVSEVKALVGELVNDVLYDCVQFHGGMGFIAETAVERLYRDARVQSIGGGATEVMLEEVAKRM